MMAIINDVTGVAGRAGISDQPQLAADGKRKSKKRTRAFTSEDRASHRSIEKQRREALNQSFLVSFKTVPVICSYTACVGLTPAGLIFIEPHIHKHGYIGKMNMFVKAYTR
jgi:hypothetical protein